MTDIGTFTLGPWSLDDDFSQEHGQFVVRGPDGVEIAAVEAWIGDDRPEATANAHLIASAPDLYEALKACRLELDYCADQLSYLGRVGGEDGSVATALRKAAIALAKASPSSSKGSEG